MPRASIREALFIKRCLRNKRKKLALYRGEGCSFWCRERRVVKSIQSQNVLRTIIWTWDTNSFSPITGTYDTVVLDIYQEKETYIHPRIAYKAGYSVKGPGCSGYRKERDSFHQNKAIQGTEKEILSSVLYFLNPHQCKPENS